MSKHLRAGPPRLVALHGADIGGSHNCDRSSSSNFPGYPGATRPALSRE
jgi:hypothetical protein